ncbi:MAG TPA: hypothetical protein DCG13_01955 [Legionellales bacterium]|nr:hypothetical protein [Legionellales bacterium]HCA89024.1 hypothetical protein [Legionellales bacterium]|tara:strand:+ start:1935 stop:2225 length:291 start_codon:yes stop_codon:yes gene_type:complete
MKLKHSLETQFTLTLAEVTYSLNVDTATVMAILDEGVIDLPQKTYNDLYFDTTTFQQLRKIVRLNQDLNINIAGACMVFELLEELDELKERLSVSS